MKFATFVIAVALALITSVPGSGALAADAYPSRAVKIIVTYPAGGTSDLMARLAAQICSEKLGKPFIVENRPGGGGNIGTDFVAKSAPDGYTLLEGTFGPITTASALYPRLPYSPSRDLIPVVNMAEVANILIAHPSVPVKDVAELVALAKSRPGRLNMAIASIGGTPHLLTEMFKQRAGIDFANIPYKGTAPALTDLVGGQVDLDIEALPAVLPFIKAGKVRALAVAGKVRIAQLPDLPTMAQTGYPDVEISAWHGLLAPAGTPPEIVALLNKTIVSALRTPTMTARLNDLGAQVIASTPQEMDAFLRAETTRWTALIQTVGITAE